MTQITEDHVEWAIVGRLGRLIEETAHETFNVTQSYALFVAILCWVMQRIRTKEEIAETDRIAASVLKRLSKERISEQPWSIPVASSERIVRIGSHAVHVPTPVNFEDHSVDRFLINLRDAVAHGDARKVLPFNVPMGNGPPVSERLLIGFKFRCSERDRDKVTWTGEITLLEEDIRRIGRHLAKVYCNALRRSETHRHESNFGADAARGVREVAA